MIVVWGNIYITNYGKVAKCFKTVRKGFQSYRFSSILIIKWAFAPIASRNSGDEVSKLSGENAN